MPTGEQPVESGTVKWFDRREEKCFGFITLESGEELFFHFNQGRFVVILDQAGEEFVEFNDNPFIAHEGALKRLKKPQAGDVLVFRRGRNRTGPTANPWTYQSLWLAAEKDTVARQEARERNLARRPVYRVWEEEKRIGQKPEEPRMLWQGRDLDQLNREHPRYVNFEYATDSLAPHASRDNYNVAITRWWEKQRHGQDGWERSSDPRPVVNGGVQHRPMTTREAAEFSDLFLLASARSSSATRMHHREEEEAYA